jgi:hypothetical protein
MLPIPNLLRADVPLTLMPTLGVQSDETRGEAERNGNVRQWEQKIGLPIVMLQPCYCLLLLSESGCMPASIQILIGLSARVRGPTTCHQTQPALSSQTCFSWPPADTYLLQVFTLSQYATKVQRLTIRYRLGHDQ